MNRLKTDVLVIGGPGIHGSVKAAADGVTLSLVKNPPISARGSTFLQVSRWWEIQVFVHDVYMAQPIESLYENKVFLEQDTRGQELAWILAKKSGERVNDLLTDYRQFKKNKRWELLPGKGVFQRNRMGPDHLGLQKL